MRVQFFSKWYLFARKWEALARTYKVPLTRDSNISTQPQVKIVHMQVDVRLHTTNLGLTPFGYIRVGNKLAHD